MARFAVYDSKGFGKYVAEKKRPRRPLSSRDFEELKKTLNEMKNELLALRKKT